MDEMSRAGHHRASSIAAALWGVGCMLVLVGTVAPYAEGFSDGDDDQSILDFSHLASTWPFALTYVVAITAVPTVAVLGRRRPRAVGGFLCGVGLIVSLDFLGAYVIGPATYEDTGFDLRAGPVLGAIGAVFVSAGGLVLLAYAAARSATAVSRAMPAEVGRVPSWLLAAMVALAVASAGVGVVTIVVGDFADDSNTSVKILGSSLCALAAALVVIACGASYVRGRLRPVPVVGAMLAVGGFAWLTVDIWLEPAAAVWWRLAGTLVATSVCCGYANLVALGRAGPPHPAGVAALASALAFVVTNVAAIWTVPDSGQFWRLYGVSGVVFLAATVLVPILGRWRSNATRARLSAGEAAAG